MQKVTSRQDKPPVSWDGNTKTFSITLSGLKDVGTVDTVQAAWKPPFTYVVRIREVNSGKWSFGFETPLTACGFVDLEPDTDYEVEVRSKDSRGESNPTSVRVRTNAEGGVGV